MTMMGIEVTAVTEAVGELAIPCDFGEDARHEHDQADWVMFLHPCCGEQVRVRLACDLCFTERMTVKLSAVECVDCGHISAPARKAYMRTEAL